MTEAGPNAGKSGARTPAFTIVVPAHNRATLVGRAIRSCLEQSLTDWELLVVDDGSTDGTGETVMATADPRVRLIRHRQNRGVSAARRTGACAAAADWIVLLDSDDELLPGALETMAGRLAESPEDVGRLGFMYRLPGGHVSPDPPFRGEVWDYPAYLRFASSSRRPDFLCCTRRSTFSTVPFQDDRSLELLYQFDFARHFRTATHPDVLGVVHDDAENRTARADIRSVLLRASDSARSYDSLLDRHGSAIAAHSPRWLLQLIRSTAVQHFLAGNRPAGSRLMAKLVRGAPFSPGTYALWILGLMGRRATALVMHFHALVAEFLGRHRPS